VTSIIQKAEKVTSIIHALPTQKNAGSDKLMDVTFSASKLMDVTFSALSPFQLPGCGKVESRIEILCPFEQIECPPTAIPQQQALLLAMMLEVPLIKVCDEPSPEREATRKRGGIWSVREEKPGIMSDD
jgi:hypothetical protein